MNLIGYNGELIELNGIAAVVVVVAVVTVIGGLIEFIGIAAELDIEVYAHLSLSALQINNKYK